MRVVMLANNALVDKLGGLERYVAELAAHLSARGAEVAVVAKARSQETPFDVTDESGVRLLRYPMPDKGAPGFAAQYPLATARGIRQALETVGEHDVLHAHFPVPALLPALTRKPFVYTLHAPVWRELLVEHQESYLLPRPVRRLARAGLRASERLIVRRADQIVTLSDFMRSEVAALSAAAVAKVSLVPGGVDTDRFVPSPMPSSDVGPELFTARRLVPRTGVQQLVEAMPGVLARFPNARLKVAGDGLQRPAIEAMISRLHLEDNVELLGRVPEEDLVRGYQRADLAITPTQELEGFGLSTAEALACGTPCLVTPAGANREVVSAFGTDLVTSGTSSGALADGITRVLLDAHRWTVPEAAKACRAAVHPRYSWTAVAARHLELYERLRRISRRDPRTR